MSSLCRCTIAETMPTMPNEEADTPRSLFGSRFSVLGSSFLLCFTILAAFATPSHAQDTKPRIVSARVGFLSQRAEKPNEIGWKTECWAPVYVEVQAGADAIGGEASYLLVECEDPEDVPTQVRVPVELKANESKRYLTYLRAGTRGEARVLLRTPKGDATYPLPGRPLELQSHVYLTLGGKTPDLPDAIVGMLPKEKQSGESAEIDTFPRFASYLDDAADLPDRWIGYQGADLVILNTSDQKFLDSATQKQVDALTEWISRGGRLVVTINPKNMLTQEQFMHIDRPPPLHMLMVANGSMTLNRVPRLEEWSRAGNKRFPAGSFATFAPLESIRSFTILLEQDGKPLIARMNVGLGTVYFLAFPLDAAPFSQWDGRTDFLRAMLARFAPRAPNVHSETPTQRGAENEDVTTDLQRTLNRFDVRPMSFALVAFLVVAYILMVGPIDYFLLKNVIGRLEWTWASFPIVVAVASLLALYTADRIKGHERRINRIDVLDFHFNNGQQFESVMTRGNSFFTLMSPENASYSVAAESQPAFLREKQRPGPMDLMTWLGRPENYYGGSGRAGSPSWLRNAYRYGEGDATLVDVPVPIWGTKSFWASWSAELNADRLPRPLKMDLSYHQKQHKGRDIKISGTITNNLPNDLTDVWILYHTHAYPVGDLPSGKTTTIGLDAASGVQFRDWGVRPDRQEATPTAQGDYDPTKTMKRILFHEKVDNANVIRNHSLRMLDWSWRLTEEPPASVRDAKPRDAILYARIPRLQGDADTLQKENKTPTKLRLETEAGFTTQPSPLNAKLTQDTFIRVLMPVQPQKE